LKTNLRDEHGLVFSICKTKAGTEIFFVCIGVSASGGEPVTCTYISEDAKSKHKCGCRQCQKFIEI